MFIGSLMFSVVSRYACRVEKIPRRVAAPKTSRTGGVQAFCIDSTIERLRAFVKEGIGHGYFGAAASATGRVSRPWLAAIRHDWTAAGPENRLVLSGPMLDNSR